MASQTGSVTFQLPEPKKKSTPKANSKDIPVILDMKTPKAVSKTKTSDKVNASSDVTAKPEKVVEKRLSTPGKIAALEEPEAYTVYRRRWFFALHGASSIVHFSLLILTILLSKWSIHVPVFTTVLLNERNNDFIRAVWTKTSVYLLPIFVYMHTLSFAFHIGTIFLWREPYLRWREQALSPLRWLHTSLTSPVRTAVVIYSAGIREGSAIALVFLIRLFTHVVSLSNELVARTVNEITWSISDRTRFFLTFMVLLIAFSVWMSCVAFIINVHTIPYAVDDTFGIALFASHSLFLVIGYANHAYFLLKPPTKYFKSEYVSVLAESSDAIVVTLLFLTQVMQKENYMWGSKYWQPI